MNEFVNLRPGTPLENGTERWLLQSSICPPRLYQRPLLQFLYRYVQSEHIAEELTQEVFFRIYRYRDTYVPSAKFTTWLFRIAGRIAINFLRTSQLEKLNTSLDAPDRELTYRCLPDRRLTPEQALVLRARATEIRRAIDLLPTNQRTAVIMHKYQERSYYDIATTLHCSESAVKSLLFRAYERLRGRLAHLAA